MPVVRWTFQDAVEAETYELEVNPREGGSPQYQKSINYQSCTAPDGKTLIFEGADKPIELEWSGVILSQTMYETLIDWYQKRRQILLTDDLNRSMWIYITQFSPRRQRAYSHPYKHEYTIRATILDWA